MRPTFADPNIDFVFKRLLGVPEHRQMLIGLLDALLEHDDEHGIAELELVDDARFPHTRELKQAIVDVRCRDVHGASYLVELQMLSVEGFERRVVYNATRSYTNQLGTGSAVTGIDNVIGVGICDFTLWSSEDVPMLSRWRMQEQHSGGLGIGQIQFVFLELPKYWVGERPEAALRSFRLEHCDPFPDPDPGILRRLPRNPQRPAAK